MTNLVEHDSSKLASSEVLCSAVLRQIVDAQESQRQIETDCTTNDLLDLFPVFRFDDTLLDIITLSKRDQLIHSEFLTTESSDPVPRLSIETVNDLACSACSEFISFLYANPGTEAHLEVRLEEYSLYTKTSIFPDDVDKSLGDLLGEEVLNGSQSPLERHAVQIVIPVVYNFLE